jgi:hypothetical protein
MSANVNGDTYKIKAGKHFAVVWDADLENDASLRNFYVFVDNRHIRL